ncbi:MAG: AzlD domain-containing protein [Lachnospiraceae bacterium]|nr:AzlD domain-containing protein [Lachnospiraceae bacterium]
MTYTFLAIAVSAVVTYALRGAMFVLIKGDRTLPGWLERLGGVLPSAIMAVLVVYCLKGVKTDFTGSGIQGLIAAFVTGLSYKWKHSTFLSMIIGTALYMILIRVF